MDTIESTSTYLPKITIKKVNDNSYYGVFCNDDETIKKYDLIIREKSNYYVNYDNNDEKSCIYGKLAKKVSASKINYQNVSSKNDCNKSELCKKYKNLHSMLELNTFSMNTLTNKESTGIIFFPFVSKVNHSCDPNADFIIFGNVICIIANRQIEAKEEITINYLNMNNEVFDKRFINRFLNFKCTCKKCSEESPDETELESTRTEDIIYKNIKQHISNVVEEKSKTSNDENDLSIICEAALKYSESLPNNKQMTRDILQLALEIKSSDFETYITLYNFFIDRFKKIVNDKIDDQLTMAYYFFEDASRKFMINGNDGMFDSLNYMIKLDSMEDTNFKKNTSSKLYKLMSLFCYKIISSKMKNLEEIQNSDFNNKRVLLRALGNLRVYKFIKEDVERLLADFETFIKIERKNCILFDKAIAIIGENEKTVKLVKK